MIFRDRLLAFLQSLGISVCMTFLFSVSDCAAQASRVAATLEGTVTDSSRAAIPTSKIAIHNILTGQSRVISTNDQGLFRAEQLAVGTYELRVEQSGFAPYWYRNLVLSLGQTSRLEIVLFPASASEQVTVTARPLAIDASQTSLVSSIDQERIEELPVRSRNYLDFVLLAPGVPSAPKESMVN